MTNREYIQTLSDEEFYLFMWRPCRLCNYADKERDEAQKIKTICRRPQASNSNCRDPILAFLKAEHDEMKGLEVKE